VVKRRELARALLGMSIGPGLLAGMMAVSGCSSEETAITDPKAAEIQRNRIKRISGGEDDHIGAEKVKGKGKGRPRVR